MGDIKFGPRQKANPTPSSIADICDLLAGFFGIVSGFLIVASFIPKSVSDIISPIITALLIPCCLYFKGWFGKRVSARSVPIGDVKEIQDKPEDKL